MNTDESEILGRVAEDALSRRRLGEPPQAGDYTGITPDLAPDVARLIEAQRVLEELASAVNEVTEAKRPRRLGEFRIVRRIGVGGMGEVYEAVQETLDRRVALKILGGGRTDMVARERFKREARAAAGLHHTNIVPVYGTGEADGVQFYAMQYIDGQSVRDVLD